MRALRLALVTLALLGVAASAAQARQAGYRTVVNGGVKATLSWAKGPGMLGTDPRVTITRDGVREVDHRRLTRLCDLCTSIIRPRTALHVRDVDADGAPEVVADLFSGGAHCCWSTVVFVPKDGTYRARLAEWGNAGYVLKDLDGNGAPEFVTTDDAFSSAFTSYAGSYRPPRFLSLIGQKLVDVTRSFPALIGADITEIDKLLAQYRGKSGTELEGLIAARMADLALLGRAAEIGPYLDQAHQRGDTDAKFKAALLKFLRNSGYID
ncbi:MAG: hypothetical protein JWM73_1442 [Solirubrobacterales bacterium]|nr:hypothetical protein [Solirubrobacterales bacterium]